MYTLDPERNSTFGMWSLNKKSLRSLRFSLPLMVVAVVGIALCAAAGYGQVPMLNSVNNQTQTPIPGAGHDYQHLLGETVNFSNGSVSLKISFPEAPGRGLSLAPKWSYSSASVNPLDSADGNTPQWDYEHFWPQEDGWNLAEGFPLATAQVWTVQANENGQFGYVRSGNTIVPCNFQSGMTFTDMAGVTHNLRIGAESYASNPQSGATYTCDQQTTSAPNGDGQVVGILNQNTATNDLFSASPTTGDFWVMDKNGTGYYFGGGQSTQSAGAKLWPGVIGDKNGNVISNGPILTDTIGRTSGLFPYTISSSSSFTIDGVKYTPVWSTANVNYTINTQGGANPSSGSGIGCFAIPKNVTGTRNVLSSLALPNGQQYTMYYGNNNPTDSTVLNNYGLINEIIYPDGGWVKYTWQLTSGFNEMADFGGEVLSSSITDQYTQQPFGCAWQYQTPVLASREVSFDGTHVAQTQSFSYSTNWSYASDGSVNSWTSKTTTVSTTDNVTGLTASTVYAYSPYTPPAQPYASGGNAVEIPLESQITYYDWGQTTPTKTVNKAWVDQFNMYSESTTINATNQTSETIYYYALPPCGTPMTNSLTYLAEQDDYDFGTGAPGSLKKKTIYNYSCFGPTNATAPSTWTWTPPPQVSSVTIEDGSGNIVAATQYGYDGSALTQATAVQNSTTTAITVRSNLTSITKCATLPSSVPHLSSPLPTLAQQQAGLPTLPASTTLCSARTNPTVYYTYDTTGQPTSMTDANGNMTQYFFADNFSDTTSAPSTNAYLTKVTRPTVNGVPHISQFGYRYSDGLLTSSTDENGYATPNSPAHNTIYSYNDPLNRLTEILPPNGGWKKTAYVDTAPSPTITTTQLLNTSGATKSVTQTFDGMWHVVETATTDPDNASGGLVYVKTTYDGEGRELTVTNPYWTTPNGTTTFSYDALGRKVFQQQPDFTRQQWCYDGVGLEGQTNCHAHIGGSAVDSFVDAADESGNDWQRTTDGLGRLIEVTEPNGNSTTPSMETDYTYNALNDLLSVRQNGTSGSATRARTFTYDNLSRLTQSYNPEPGWICYGTTGGVPANGSNCAPGYDKNGNLLAKTDARGITINYSYDALNREFAKNYSTGEPSACTQYDAPLTVASGDADAIGKVTAEWLAPAGTCPAVNRPVATIPATAYNSAVILNHDVMGRVTSESQCPSGAACGTNYTFNYSYDLAGGTTSFNNGLTPAASTATNPALAWGVAYDNAERIANVSVTTSPFTDSAHGVAGNLISQSDPVNTLAAMGQPAYDPWGHLVNEQASLINGASSASEIAVLSQYDTRGRVVSEVAGGAQTTAVPTGSFGVIAVNGLEQSTQPPATASVTISGQGEGPVTWYPCGNSTCPVPEYDSGTITVTINGTAVQTSWGGTAAGIYLADNLAAAINSNTSTLGVNATTNGSEIWIFANSTSTVGSTIPISVTTADTSPAGLFSTPAFTATASGTTLFGGGATVYDTGNVTVTLTDATTGTAVTTAAVPWTSASTSATLASALKTAISNAASSTITATTDDTGMSISLKSALSGAASDNYSVAINVTDTTASINSGYAPGSLPTNGFQFDASSLTGAGNGAPVTNYGMIYSYVIPAGGYAANSNIVAHSDSVMGDWAFQYDTLNRLTVAAPALNAPTSYQKSVGCFNYDGFGNRTLAAFTTSSDCTRDTTATASYNSSNQVSFVSQAAPIATSAPSGFTYDSGGNVVADANNSYAYDGEGRLCAVYNSLTGSKTQYVYDASGGRVGKASFTGIFPAKNTVCAAPGAAAGFSLAAQYLLDQGGDQVTELNTSTGTMAWAHSNVWAGSHLDATYDVKGLHFHLADPLGTRRIQTNIDGAVEYSFQSLPFGDNFASLPTALATSEGIVDATENHFTGKEHDAESGNDYFGARYYASAMGRWLSPDWSAKVEPVPYAKLSDPQTLNLYAYAENNPLIHLDADGHEVLEKPKPLLCDTRVQKNMDSAQRQSARDNIHADSKTQTEHGFSASTETNPPTVGKVVAGDKGGSMNVPKLDDPNVRITDTIHTHSAGDGMPSTPENAVAGKENADTTAATTPGYRMNVYVMSSNGLSVAPGNGDTPHFVITGADWEKQLQQACSAQQIVPVQTGGQK